VAEKRILFAALAIPAKIAHDSDEGWGCAPLLLAWRTWSKSQDDLYGLLGLYSRHDIMTASAAGTSYLSTTSTNAKKRFLSPLFGWQKTRQAHKRGYWYPITPLVGVRTGGGKREDGSSLLQPQAQAVEPRLQHLLLAVRNMRITPKNAAREREPEPPAGALSLYCHSYETLTNGATAWTGRKESCTHDDYAYPLGFSLRNKTVAMPRAARRQPPAHE
jgi:hypothetical protein